MQGVLTMPAILAQILPSQGAQMNEWNPGEAGGVFAGVVAALAVIGKGLAWLLDWNESRSTGREVRLSKWEASLLAREMAYREKIEVELTATRHELAMARSDVERVEEELGTLRSALAEVTRELHRHAPDNPALARAARWVTGSSNQAPVAASSE
jgi:hypothetical protein